MTELKPCPFCDSKDVVIELCHVEYPTRYSWYVRCRDCNKGDLISYLNEKRAIEAWNTRHERTCSMIGMNYVNHDTWEETPIDKVMCSECGHEFELYDLGCELGERVYRHNYCSNCGAKVIKEEE